MPGYSQTGNRANSGAPAGNIDRGAVPTPVGHDNPEENTTDGLGKPTDKPAGQYMSNESVPPTVSSTALDDSSLENMGCYAKKFSS